MATTLTHTFPTVDRWDLPDIFLVPQDSVEEYLARIAVIPVLTPAAEQDLGHAISRGDTDARIQLTWHNLRYAAHLARRWEDHPLQETVWSLSDGIQAANSGLWRATRTFNPTVARFTTYATAWIRQAWTRERQNFLWAIRLPTHAVEEWWAYQRAVKAWEQSRGQEPTPQELVTLLGWSLERVAFWQTWAATQAHVASLDESFVDDGSPLTEMIPDTADSIWSHLLAVQQRDLVTTLLGLLSEREADVLRLRFGLSGSPLTLQEIAGIYHLTRERIRQIEAHALKTLQQWVQAHPDLRWADYASDS